MQNLHLRHSCNFLLYFPSFSKSQNVCLITKCKNNKSGHLPRRLPFRGMAMNDPRLPPMTLCGRRKGGFLKDPVYWCKNECMLWDDGGRPFLTMGSETTTRPQSIHTHLCNYMSGFICDPISTVNTSLKWLLYDTTQAEGRGNIRELSRKRWRLWKFTRMLCRSCRYGNVATVRYSR